MKATTEQQRWLKWAQTKKSLSQRPPCVLKVGQEIILLWKWINLAKKNVFKKYTIKDPKLRNPN